MTITRRVAAFAGRRRVALTADRRSWGILARRLPTPMPVDRAAGAEIAQNAIPTPAWTTAPRARRPQRPTRPYVSVIDEKKKTVR